MTDEVKIREMVRRIVYRTVGLSESAPRRPLITEEAVRNLPFGDSFTVPKDALITPLARQVAMDRHIAIVQEANPGAAKKARSLFESSNAKGKLKAVAFGADHGGYELKELLKASVRDQGYEVID